MRQFDVSLIRDAVYDMASSVCYSLPPDFVAAMRAAYEEEDSQQGKETLGILLANLDLSEQGRYPACQDTGMGVVWLDVGRDVHLSGDPYEAIQEGVRRAYADSYLRLSVVADPLRRKNTGDNTPALVTTQLVAGDKVRVQFAAKGFGSENASQLKMLKPSDGIDGVKNFVIHVVNEAGPNACPPLVVGVGIGGTFDHAARIAKEALMRPLGETHPDPFYAELEADWLASINELGYGPQGYGGRTTALAVHIATLGTHIAGLPVAVNINCHMTRHEERIL